MKEIISHNITLVVTAIAFVLSGIWFYQTKEYEPLIGIFVSGGALITGIFFRQSSTGKGTNQNTNQANVKGNNNTVIQDITGSNININTGNQNKAVNNSEGSTLKTKGLKGKKGINIEAVQKNKSNANFEDFDTDGEIKINIKQE